MLSLAGTQADEVSLLQNGVFMLVQSNTDLREPAHWEGGKNLFFVSLVQHLPVELRSVLQRIS